MRARVNHRLRYNRSWGSIARPIEEARDFMSAHGIELVEWRLEECYQLVE